MPALNCGGGGSMNPMVAISDNVVFAMCYNIIFNHYGDVEVMITKFSY